VLNRSYQVHSTAQTNGYVEGFNGRLRDELLNCELFLSLPEARYVLDAWRLEYNHRRPHSGIGWRTPAAFAATLEAKAAGTFPAATPAGPAVPVRVPPAQPANHHPILS
jgi:putative transposase